jgi:hypothetical protein
MQRDIELEAIAQKYAAVESVLDERGRRLWCAAESRAIGFGGDASTRAYISVVCMLAWPSHSDTLDVTRLRGRFSASLSWSVLSPVLYLVFDR